MQSLQLMTGLATLVQDPSAPVLSRTAAQVWLLCYIFRGVSLYWCCVFDVQTLLRLHEPKYIELWDSDDTMIAFWDIRCVCVCVCACVCVCVCVYNVCMYVCLCACMQAWMCDLIFTL